MTDPWSDDQADEPLLAFDPPMEDQVIGEDDTFRTQNASLSDWERRNIIERTSGSIHTRVELLSVSHGSYNEGGDEATLLVFRFRFDPQKSSRRVLWAKAEIEFFAEDALDLTVEAIAPEERWAVVPTTDTETTTRSGQLNLGAPGVPLLHAGASAGLEKTYSRDVKDATTVTGAINLGTGKNSGGSTVAVWNFQENERHKTGVPDSVTTAILLRRSCDERFTAVVTLEADVDWVTGLERKFAKIPLDDPILFNPKAKDFAVIMAEPVIPNGQKPVLEVRTTIDNEEDNKEPNNTALKVIQEGGHLVTTDENSDNEGPFVPFDVILIHGIYGTSLDSWTRGSNTIWINKAFADVSARMGRIMSYGYHTDVEKGRYYSPYGIYQEAEALLEALRELRTPEIKEARRPIYLFSHDIGGTIVKAALSMATDREDKYADILHYTRAMCFFGYPHRYPSINLLEESVLRLLDQKRQLWSGNMVWYAKCLTKTIVKVNDAFLGTQMLTQANFVNVVSNLHLEPSQQIFPLSMSTMATPFERVVKMEKPNCDLILAGEDGSHPVNDVSYSDWLMGDLNDEQRVALRKVINQASPVLPYLQADEDWQHPDLLDLPERTETIIVHMRCSSGAEAETENASFFLNNRSGTYHPLLYMKFDAHDIRFNTCEAMLRTFIARISCNRLQTESTVSRTMDTLITFEALHRVTLFNEAERLQSIEDIEMGIQVLGCFDECDDSSIWFLREMRKRLLRNEMWSKLLITTTKGTPGDANIVSALSEFPPEYVRTINYHPKEPIPFPVDMEASKLMKELGECIGADLHRDVLSILSSCAGDHDLCGLVLEWLGSCTTQIARITRLLDKAVTPALLFAEILEDIAEAHRTWAKMLLSWLLACYRPLKCDEFHRVSDTVWTRVVENEATRPNLADILQSFHGLITPVNGEIKFRHPATRAWLESRHLVVDKGIWYDTDETERHEMVLRTCIDYIQDAAENPDDATLHLPYAIEFWPKHWQLVEASEMQVVDLFENDTVFEFWANSLVGLKNTLLKPPPKHIKPLPVAAHLGLTTVAETLLRRSPDQPESRDQALIEACRAGHVAVIRLLVRSYSDGLDFGDENLHEAARVAGNSYNSEALREIVNGLPEPPKTASVQESTRHEFEANSKPTKSQEKNDQQDNSSDGAMKGEQEVKDTKSEKHVSGPLDWLVMPMNRAVKSGMDDVVTRLLQLGVDPTPPKGITPYGNSFIYTAANTSNISCAKLLIEAGANPAARNDQGYTPLHTAIDWASGETVEFLLEHGASIEDEDPENRRALDMAASWGSFTALEIILQQKDEVERLEHHPDRYPVNQAAESGHNKCLEILLRHGFSPNIVTSIGETALRSAIQAGRIDLCKILLDNKADPDLTPENANTPLILAISMGDLGMVKLLIEHGATIDKREAPPDEGWSRTPLNVAADWSQPDIVQYLLEKGADPNARDSDDIPVIGAAVDGGHTNMVKWLVEASAEVNVTYFEAKSTPLHEATAYPEMVRLLLQHGADISKVNAYSRTALNYAICANSLAAVQIMLEETKAKSDLGAANIEPDLRAAVSSGWTEVVEALLEAGADVNAVDEENKSLLACAMTKGASIDMIRKVLEYNPDLELKDNKQNTALHCINTSTSLDTVRLVVNAGGKLNVLNFENETPLIYAIRAQLDDVFSYMLRKEPALLNGSVALSKQSVTPLHEACRAGTLAMVRSLIEHQVEVNSTCKDVYGTPLIAATLRSDVVSSGLASEIIALLLLNGADPKVSAGLFRYPLISACLACPTETIKLLLNSDASPLDQDSLTRKPVHLSCYNSLEVLNLLEIPDSDFSARDIVGRVPLHYAVMRGDVELVQAVLERSKRAGIDIDVKDDDGWTPLLWAFRASPIWNHQLVDPVSTLQVVSLLVKNGADINAKGHGSGKDWTFRDVAYYHHAESIDMLLDQKSAASEGNTPAKKRGSLPVPPGDESWFCHCCLLESHGIYFKCSACHDFTLCYKCHWSSSKTHPDHSSYIRHGSEWYDGSTSDQEKISEMGIDDGGRDEDVLLDREEILYEDFDSAMSDETSEH
ncbi:hypothetical protein FocTR4_00002496 [Fusarium oxysporum f. sp. cubense]|uniref:Uncharacterized protein n=2 Tax=Fusarium oxysporum species complex TaxID=171631 RepID=A0A5C6TBN6_FUSOC|nr:hypothetical protein FocTR4_00002496 [Fusarium oxysporum f. sp. cubense]